MEAFGQQFDGGFGGSVHRLAGYGEKASHARHVGDVGLRPLQESGQKGLGHVQGAVQVDPHDPIDVVEVEVVEANERLDDAGVVDQAVGRTEGVRHPLG